MSTTNKPTEYDVTFAVKEWLLGHGWDVVAFNPPGSQGTFTIPNPSKDPTYRGQTGSESPDIIAIKNASNILVVESKPQYERSDVIKLLGLARNRERVDLMLELLEKVCSANKVSFKRPVNIFLAKAHGGKERPRKGMQTFIVSTDIDWVPDQIDPAVDPYQSMSVEFFGENQSVQRLFED
ncbi:MAG: hypothetical protein Q7R79_05115 [bacterium]|nr:hypothetical protein [bacterium]